MATAKKMAEPMRVVIDDKSASLSSSASARAEPSSKDIIRIPEDMPRSSGDIPTQRIITRARDCLNTRDHSGFKTCIRDLNVKLEEHGIEGTLYADRPMETPLTDGDTYWYRQRPVYANDTKPEAFARLAQQYVRRLPFHLQLEELNLLQTRFPYSLIGAAMLGMKGSSGGGLSLYTGPSVYGYGDLYQFLGYPFSKGLLHDYRNPLYVPAAPVPNTGLNTMMNKVLLNNPYTMLLTAYKLGREILHKYPTRFENIDSDPLYSTFKDTIEESMRNLANPNRLKFIVLGDDLPMTKYRRENLADSLRLFRNALSMNQVIKSIKSLDSGEGKRATKGKGKGKDKEEKRHHRASVHVPKIGSMEIK